MTTYDLTCAATRDGGLLPHPALRPAHQQPKLVRVAEGIEMPVTRLAAAERTATGARA